MEGLGDILENENTQAHARFHSRKNDESIFVRF